MKKSLLILTSLSLLSACGQKSEEVKPTPPQSTDFDAGAFGPHGSY